MKINYNLTGPKRKSLIGAISIELNAPTKYLGAPTFAYEVGDFHVDKNGILEGEDNPELVAKLYETHGFEAITEKYDTSLTEVEPVLEDSQIVNEVVLNNNGIVNDNEELSSYVEPEQSYEIETNRLIIDLPRSEFNDVALKNLKSLVENKSLLIKNALGTDCIPIIVSDETVSFPWFKGELGPDEVKTYTRFVTALCQMAKTQKRVNITEKQVINEKYAFRCFIMRLGFIGSEYKMERKILLKNLSGNSAFKNGIQIKTEEEITNE